MKRALSKLHTTGLFLLFQIAVPHALWAKPEREGEDGGGGGSGSCAVASGIGAVMGALATAAAIGALATPVGSAAWLGFTAASIIFGIPSTGISIGTAIGCN